LKTLLPQKLFDVSFTNITYVAGMQLLNQLWLLKVMLRCVNDGFKTIKPGHQTSGNASYSQMSHPLHCSLHQKEFTFWEHPRKLTIQNASRGRLCDGLGSNIMIFCWSQYYPHCRITRTEYVDRLGNQMHPMIQALFPNNAVFQQKKKKNTTMPPLTQFSHCLKSIKMNFIIFPGQYNHHTWTSLNHSGQFWRLQWGTDSHLQHL
jgi:hypothetical protein